MFVLRAEGALEQQPWNTVECARADICSADVWYGSAPSLSRLTWQGQTETPLTRCKAKYYLFWLVWHSLEPFGVVVKWNMTPGEEKWPGWDGQGRTFHSGSGSGPWALHQPDVCSVTSLCLLSPLLLLTRHLSVWAALDNCLCHQPVWVSSDLPCVLIWAGAPGPVCSAKNQWNCTQWVLIGVGADEQRLMVDQGANDPVWAFYHWGKCYFGGVGVCWCHWLVGGGGCLGFGFFFSLWNLVFFPPLNAVTQSSAELVSQRCIFVFVNICGWIRLLTPDLKSYSLPNQCFKHSWKTKSKVNEQMVNPHSGRQLWWGVHTAILHGASSMCRLQGRVLGAPHPTGPMSGLSQAGCGIAAAVSTAEEASWQCKAQQQHIWTPTALAAASERE